MTLVNDFRAHHSPLVTWLNIHNVLWRVKEVTTDIMIPSLCNRQLTFYNTFKVKMILTEKAFDNIREKEDFLLIAQEVLHGLVVKCCWSWFQAALDLSGFSWQDTSESQPRTGETQERLK